MIYGFEIVWVRLLRFFFIVKRENFLDYFKFFEVFFFSFLSLSFKLNFNCVIRELTIYFMELDERTNPTKSIETMKKRRE